MVKRSDSRREECDLDRIQDIFPSDNLRLYEPDPLSPRKGLLRSKSAAASKLQRALSGKNKNENRSHSPNSNGDYSNNNVPRNQRRSEGCSRSYVMDSPVHFIMGVQSQERHLFLFSDLLLIAKPRSSGNYKLKEKVRVCELWLANCMDDVCEATKSPENSFVMGWPTTNVVVTFSSPQTKELWQDKLQQLIAKAKEREGNIVTSLQVSSFDPETQEETCKTVKINNYHTASDTIRLILEQYGHNEEDIEDYQLWVKTSKDDAPYPLIGHEYPFCIKMNFVRQLLQRSELDLHNFSNISTDAKCCFILRRHYTKGPPEITKKVKKPRRPTIINWPFKKQPNKQESLDSGILSPTPGTLFGQPLGKLSEDDSLPKPVMNMLIQLFHKGPFTLGIFRKSANARACKDLKEKLEADPDCDLGNVPIVVLASVFKEFLRSLPDCLLQSDLYFDWLHCLTIENNWERREKIVSLLGHLQPANLQLLRHTLCILWHIAQNSEENRMTPLNLGVCIGPSILFQNILPTHQSPTLQCEATSKQVPKLIAYLIDQCTDIFGEDCLHIFGDGPERDSSHHDSGAEESDSLHSLQDVGVGHRRDDSSIDSLERVLLEDGDPSPKLPNKSKMSLTNLSRDSGLTLSDTQLYNPEEELESEASSNGDSRRGVGISHSLAKSVPHLDVTGLDNTSIISYSHGRNAGVSIDGSCNDVVRKRRQIQECSRPRGQGVPSTTKSASLRSPSHQNSYSSLHPMLHCTQSLGSKPNGRERHSNGEYGKSPVHAKLKRLHHHQQPSQRHQKNSPIPSTMHSTLRRSASEESLLQKYMNGEQKRPAHHRKGRAPSPPGGTSWEHRNGSTAGAPSHLYSSLSPSAIQPDRHALWFASHSGNIDFKRSQSTSQIDEVDCVHNLSATSVVSSESSSTRVQVTNSPHVSHVQVESCTHSSQRVSSVCSSSSELSQRSQLSHFSQNSTSSHASHGSGSSNRSHSSTGSRGSQKTKYSPSKPSLPSYQEAVNRKQMLRRLRTISTLEQVTEQMRLEQTTLSARARQLYEESVKLYNRQVEDSDDTVRAMPARVDSGDEENANPPPLPPKPHQTLHRTASEGTPLRLRHHPPVHVSDSQILSQKWATSRKGAHVTYQYCTRRSEFPEDWKPEISWSVANLRAMFNAQQVQETNAKTLKRTSTERHPSTNNARSPPPYRPPPSHRITTDGSATANQNQARTDEKDSTTNVATRHKRSDSISSSNCEESYV